MTAYHNSKTRQKEVPIEYQPGGKWLADIQTRRADWLKALDQKDNSGLAVLLGDFFRNTGVAGLWEHGYYEDINHGRNATKKRFVNLILRDYHDWNEFVPSNYRDGLPTIPMVGNPWGYFILDQLVTPTCFRHHYYAMKANKLTEYTSAPVIAEIGGGFGGVAYYLLAARAGVKYLNFDLPEILLVASYYLMTAFPNKRFLLFGELEDSHITQTVLENYDVILMPNFQLVFLQDNSVDLHMNTKSLPEMDHHTIVEYLNQISRTTNRYFFQANSDRTFSHDFGRHTEVPVSTFPELEPSFDRLYKSRSVWSGGSERYRELLFERGDAQVKL